MQFRTKIQFSRRKENSSNEMNHLENIKLCFERKIDEKSLEPFVECLAVLQHDWTLFESFHYLVVSNQRKGTFKSIPWLINIGED